MTRSLMMSEPGFRGRWYFLHADRILSIKCETEIMYKIVANLCLQPEYLLSSRCGSRPSYAGKVPLDPAGTC